MKALILLEKADTSDEALLALDICANASRFGLEVSVAELEDGRLSGEFERFGFRFHRIHRETGVDLNAVYSLRKVIRSGNFDIIHSFGTAQALLAYSATIGMKRIKRVLSIFSVEEGRRFRSKNILRRMDANIVPSRSFFPRLRKTTGVDTKKKFYLVPKGVDPKRVGRDSSMFRRALRVGEKTSLVAMAADFDGSGSADHITVAQALPNVFKKKKNSRFVFLGSVEPAGEDVLDACVEFCDSKGFGKKVFFPGPRPDPQPWMTSMAAYVFAASGDTFPTSVVEAMLAGIPVIVSDTEPLLELTNSGKCAGVFVRGDEKELSDSLVAVLGNKNLWEKRSREARKFAESNFHIDYHLTSLKTLYFELAGEKKTKEVREKAEEPEKKNKKEKKRKTETGSLLGLD